MEASFHINLHVGSDEVSVDFKEERTPESIEIGGHFYRYSSLMIYLEIP
ncbi:MAG: hypothetical protein HY860_02665 [Chlamydiales bacterium]|nr:hypothetical protein [Chlamydiales bacterium]